MCSISISYQFSHSLTHYLTLPITILAFSSSFFPLKLLRLKWERGLPTRSKGFVSCLILQRLHLKFYASKDIVLIIMNVCMYIVWTIAENYIWALGVFAYLLRKVSYFNTSNVVGHKRREWFKWTWVLQCWQNNPDSKPWDVCHLLYHTLPGSTLIPYRNISCRISIAA